MSTLPSKFDVFRECRDMDVSLWSCPRFLFVVMGALIIAAILVTYAVGQRYATPETVIVSVSVLTILLLILTHVIVAAFEEVLRARRDERAQARKILLLRDQFVYMAVHHLRSAGTAIKWGLKMLESAEGPQSLSEKDVASIVRQMREKNDELLLLARHILLATKIDAGDMSPSIAAVDLRALCGSILEEERQAIVEGNVAVKAEFPEELPRCAADPQYLREAMTLLIGNAIKHSAREGAAVRIAAGVEGGQMFVSIENNGPGIPQDEQPHVFERYWRSRGPGRSEGSGLPLYIVRALIEQMGGAVSFSSIPGKTVFTVRLAPIAGGDS